MISFVRVDNRLIHGQVVEAWLPKLKVRRLVVADDEAGDNLLMRSAMALAVPESVEVRIDSLGRTDFEALHTDAVPTLLVFREISDVVRAREKGLRLSQVNVGNVHAREGRTAVSSSVYLSPDEKARLRAWEAEGIVVELRAVPNEAPLLPSSFPKEA